MWKSSYYESTAKCIRSSNIKTPQTQRYMICFCLVFLKLIGDLLKIYRINDIFPFVTIKQKTVVGFSPPKPIASEIFMLFFFNSMLYFFLWLVFVVPSAVAWWRERKSVPIFRLCREPHVPTSDCPFYVSVSQGFSHWGLSMRSCYLADCVCDAVCKSVQWKANSVCVRRWNGLPLMVLVDLSYRILRTQLWVV